MVADCWKNRHGAQGPFDGASKGALESEFGTAVDDEVIKTILEKGTLQESQVCTFFLQGWLMMLRMGEALVKAVVIANHMCVWAGGWLVGHIKISESSPTASIAVVGMTATQTGALERV